jgi:hypothetical protein
VAVQDHRHPTGRSADGCELIFEIVVVPRPMLDEGSRAPRGPKAAQIEGVRFDADRRETRRNVRMTSGVLRDPVDQE